MFHLEPYKSTSSRYECPECHHKQVFVKYVDEEGNHVFPAFVGRCNREHHCGYHYTPRMFFRDNPQCKQEFFQNSRSSIGVDYVHKVNRDKQTVKVREPSYIQRDMMETTLRNYQDNNFVIFLENLVGKAKAMKMISRYHVGTSDRWKGATVFWQVDKEGQVHHGKIMLYDLITGHRESRFSTYEYYKELSDFNLVQCFFGEHLLTDQSKVVGLVESEKTAIIATEFMPDIIWLASGGANGCLNQRMHILTGRDVILFPDLGKETDWSIIAARMKMAGIKNVSVSHVLERNASEEERELGLDISDYLIRHMKNQIPEGYPF